MTLHTGKQAIDLYYKNYFDSYASSESMPIVFHGGEPLLRYDTMHRLVRYAEEKLKTICTDKKCSFSFTTNGTLLREEMLEFFKNHNFNINVSLDGSPTTHNLHRIDQAGKPTHDKTLKSAIILREYLGNAFNVRVTITPETVDALVANVLWFIKNGFKRINLCIDFFQDWSIGLEIFKEQMEELEDLYLNMMSEGQELYIDIFDARFSEYLLLKKSLFCNAGVGSIVVDADGKIYPCVYAIDLEMDIGTTVSWG